MESNMELEPVWQHTRWFPVASVTGHAQFVLSSIVTLTHNSASIHSLPWLLQLTIIGIYDKQIQAPEMCMYHALFCSIHMLRNTCELLGHPCSSDINSITWLMHLCLPVTRFSSSCSYLSNTPIDSGCLTWYIWLRCLEMFYPFFLQLRHQSGT